MYHSCQSGYFLYSTECVPGLLNNIPYTVLINAGYADIFNQLNSQITTDSDVNSWRSSCNAETFLCLGGGWAGDDILRVLACGNCYAITTETVINCPSLNGLAWWYYTLNKSIGFSVNSSINQYIADSYDMSSELRLSWHLDGVTGGYRAGSLISNGAELQKYVFIKNIVSSI